MSTASHKFLRCTHCGNMVGMIENAGVKIICCGEPMAELTANTSDASGEKHLPVTEISGAIVKVKVGSAPHPMTKEHGISWIYLQTARGGQRKEIREGELPETVFSCINDTPVAVFAYCNLHGLWKTDIEE